MVSQPSAMACLVWSVASDAARVGAAEASTPAPRKTDSAASISASRRPRRRPESGLYRRIALRIGQDKLYGNGCGGDGEIVSGQLSHTRWTRLRLGPAAL